MLNPKHLVLALFMALAGLALPPEPARAQGCGPSNPNCIVPTAPFGTSTNQAASTAFVQQAKAGTYTNLSGDCTATSLGVITCTKTNGVLFGALATAAPGTGLAIAGGNLNLQPSQAATIGGVKSLTCSTSNWFSSLSTGGAFGCTEPSFSDLLGQATSSQLASGAAATNVGTLGGDLSGNLPNPTVAKITGSPVNFGSANANDTIYYNGTSWLHNSIIAVINAACSTSLTRGACSQLFGYANILWFGAACDGATVDTTAIQSWLTAIAGNGSVGLIPAGKTCVYDGLLSITSNTTIFGYGATLQQKASGTGSANSGLVWGPTSQVGSGVDTTAIFGLTIDGNRANNTNTAGSGALLYLISTTRATLRDVKTINGRGDGIDIGGDSSVNGRSSFITLDNVNSTGNRRNNISVFGVDRGTLGNITVNTASNTTNDGPQCGIDFEPNGSTSNNTNIYAFAITASGNGALSSGTGGSGVCVFNSAANTTGLIINGVTAVGNQHYGVDVASGFSPANVRLMGVSGSTNGTALVDTANVVDWFPSGIVKNAANSCGAGFACIGVPN